MGNLCSIGGNVKFLLGVDHPTDLISTYPFHANILCDGIDAISKGDIIVEDDVWIGENSVILSGVHIGQGAIVAAGAIVTKMFLHMPLWVVFLQQLLNIDLTKKFVKY